MKNWCLARLNLSFLQSQQHIGDPTADRKRMSRLQALQGALQHVHLQRHVVHLPQKCLILLIPPESALWAPLSDASDRPSPEAPPTQPLVSYVP